MEEVVSNYDVVSTNISHTFFGDVETVRTSVTTFTELKSALDAVQYLIDRKIKDARINDNVDSLAFSDDLKKLNKERDNIIRKIREKLDETFHE